MAVVAADEEQKGMRRLRGGGCGETFDFSDREASTTVDLTKRLIHSDSKGVFEGKGEELGWRSVSWSPGEGHRFRLG